MGCDKNFSKFPASFSSQIDFELAFALRSLSVCSAFRCWANRSTGICMRWNCIFKIPASWCWNCEALKRSLVECIITCAGADFDCTRSRELEDPFKSEMSGACTTGTIGRLAMWWVYRLTWLSHAKSVRRSGWNRSFAVYFLQVCMGLEVVVFCSLLRRYLTWSFWIIDVRFQFAERCLVHLRMFSYQGAFICLYFSTSQTFATICEEKSSPIIGDLSCFV